MFITFYHTKSHMLILTDLLVIAVKLQSTENLCMITMLLYIPPPKKKISANVLKAY